MDKPYVFISYSTKDQEYADKVYKILTDNGINAWIATRDIHAGDSFANEITNAIKNCKAFVFILSQNSDDSPHCGNELSIAFSLRKKIIPLRLHEFNLSESNTYFLQQAQWIDFYKNEESSFDELILKVNSALNEKEVVKTAVKIKTQEEKQIENIIKRAYLSLEEKDFSSADDFAEKILDINMEYAEAYLIKLLCELKLKNVEALKTNKIKISDNKNFKYAKKYADEEFLLKLEEIENEQNKYISYSFVKEQIKQPIFDYFLIKALLEKDSLKGYKDCDKILKNLTSTYDGKIIEKIFSEIYTPYFRQIIVLPTGLTLSQIEEEEKNSRERTKKEISKTAKETNSIIDKIIDEKVKENVEKDYHKFVSLSMLFQDCKYDECIEQLTTENAFEYIDKEKVNGLIKTCKEEKNRKIARKEKDKQDKENRIKEQEKQREEKKKSAVKGIISAIVACVVLIIVVASVLGVKENKYQQGKQLMYQYKFKEAQEVLHNLDYKNSSELYFCAENMIDGQYYEVVEDYGLTEFVIPEGVTEIKDRAFFGCKTLTSVTIPNSVTKIGKEAFANCSSLETITIPDSVSIIAYKAFDFCVSLKEVKFGSNSKLKTIGNSAFSYCTKLTSFKVPQGVKIIYDYTFNGCTSLTEIILHENIEEIGAYVFSDCTALKKIIIPKSVTFVGDQTFGGCNNLTIYCRASSQPDGWRWNWNYSKRPVVWGYKD